MGAKPRIGCTLCLPVPIYTPLPWPGENFPQPDIGAVCPFSGNGAEMQRNTGYFPTESLEPSSNRLFSRSALNEGYLFRGSLGNVCPNPCLLLHLWIVKSAHGLYTEMLLVLLFIGAFPSSDARCKLGKFYPVIL